VYRVNSEIACNREREREKEIEKGAQTCICVGTCEWNEKDQKNKARKKHRRGEAGRRAPS